MLSLSASLFPIRGVGGFRAGPVVLLLITAISKKSPASTLQDASVLLSSCPSFEAEIFPI